MKRPRPDILSPAADVARIPFPFVLDALEEHEPTTRPLFGSTAVYLGERVVFILRKKGDTDDGVWVAFDEEREAHALAALPNLVKITRLPNVRTWRKLSARHPQFEDDVLEACRIARDTDSPLGRIPTRQRTKASAASKKKTPASKKKTPASKKKTPASKKKTPASKKKTRVPKKG